MRREFTIACKVTFLGMAVSLGLLFLSATASADTCIFDPNEAGAMIRQYGWTNDVAIEIADSDCMAAAFTNGTTTEGAVHAFLGHLLAAKAMNKLVEVEYTMGMGPIRWALWLATTMQPLRTRPVWRLAPSGSPAKVASSRIAQILR